MENFPLVKRCKEKGVHVISIRAVSDTLHEDLDPRFFHLYDSKGSLQKRTFLQYVVHDPLFILSLIKAGTTSHRARKNYSKVIRDFIASSQNLTPKTH
jgi:hypothetical protein